MADLSYVYFIRNSGTGNIKIGKADNPDRRLRTLQTATPSPLELMVTIRVTRNVFAVEGDLHRRFAHLRFEEGGGTEWFRPGTDLLAFVEDLRVGENPYRGLFSRWLASVDWAKTARSGGFIAAAVVGLLILFALGQWVFHHLVLVAVLTFIAIGLLASAAAAWKDRARGEAWLQQREDRLHDLLREDPPGQ